MTRRLFALALACHAPAPADRCAALATLQVPHVAIASAKHAGAVCRVDGIARPTDDSEIRFTVAIPDAWNGRYRQLGNGGFAGLVPEDDILAAAARGVAAAGTDDGHHSTRGIDASFAVGHPERVIDFGYRAVHETHDAALAIIRAYTGAAPHHRYFSGCSDGGREGLMEAQRFPDDFDGIVAGAPANHATRLLAAFAWTARYARLIPRAKLPAIERAALAACGGGDVVADPRACRFDVQVLRCAGADTDACLTDAELDALAHVYAGPGWFPGYEPGAEAEPGSWSDWVVGEQAVQARFARTYFANLANIAEPDFDRDVPALETRLGPILDASSPDLGAFARRGGKLIVWHGWNDPAIPPRDSIAYRDQVFAKLPDAASFYRLYLVPGMLHCEGGRGVTALPTDDAIEAWVETRHAPAALASIPPD